MRLFLIFSDIQQIIWKFLISGVHEPLSVPLRQQPEDPLEDAGDGVAVGAYPLFVVGTVVGWIAYRQAQLGITKASMDDLDHLAYFTVDLLDAHYRQFEVYREDKKQTIHKELETLANLSYGLVETQYRQQQNGRIDLAAAQESARRALKRFRSARPATSMP